MSHNRKKVEEENRRRLERHSRELATRQANRQRLVTLGKELAAGFHPVRMDSIADQLDEIDPKVRAVQVGKAATTILDAARALEPGSPTAFRRLHDEEPFIPPKFQPSLVREKEMSYVSNAMVAPRKLGSKGKQQLALALPADVVAALGFELLASIRFEVELTEAGILFRPGGTRQVSVPTWAIKGGKR